MSLYVKIFVALAPVCLIGMVFTLAQGDWWNAGTFAFLLLMMVVLYRTEKLPQRHP
jgi:Ca2+/Na+ antiporter